MNPDPLVVDIMLFGISAAWSVVVVAAYFEFVRRFVDSRPPEGGGLHDDGTVW